MRTARAPNLTPEECLLHVDQNVQAESTDIRDVVMVTLAEEVRRLSQQMRALENVFETNDALEQSYWAFDARRKGFGPWKNRPLSERDAFKTVLAVFGSWMADKDPK